jgi:IS605 OrfB family transposase
MHLVQELGKNRARCDGCNDLKKRCHCIPLTLTSVQIGLEPDVEQRDSLFRTIDAFNEACNRISSLGKMAEFQLHDACYYDLRNLGFSSQISMNAIKRVAAAWKNAESEPRFEPHSSICLDGQGVKISGDVLAITTVDGRLKIPLGLSRYHKERLSSGRILGGMNLCYRRGTKQFYVAVTIERESPEENEVRDILGVDLGITNLAHDSRNEIHTDARVEGVRNHYSDLRGRLQSVKTKNSRRRLVKLSGRERRFKKDVNHRISKALVQAAEGTPSAIAMEDLTGIRERTTVGRKQRGRHAKWAFYELRKFVEYKALRAGVPLILVDPRNTSRECPVCRFCTKKNRVSRDLFRCQRCGFSAQADYVGALNIRTNGAQELRTRAAFNLPMAAQGAAAISEPPSRGN